ncbi:MAG: hypothetical protein K2H29_07415 [Oscillospiraceae bacterium]|nr:hypothetical protein [Oscillospiraceae bacterium]
MIDLYKAIDIFRSEIKNVIIGAIVDVGHSFVFWEADENGEFLETAATAINKNTGKVTAYFEPDHWDELDKAIEIKIPEDYR